MEYTCGIGAESMLICVYEMQQSVFSCVYRAFANALEVIPSTLAENAGLNPIATVTELRNRHAQGDVTAGINVRKVCITCVCVLLSINYPSNSSETVTAHRKSQHSFF
jgi:hypothetical protein